MAKRKKGRPRSEKPMVHTAVVLPRDLLERMKIDAERSERGLSSEIRHRLLLTYDLDGPPDDSETGDLVAFIKELAISLARDLGKKWHESKYAHAAFQFGVNTFLRERAPESDEGVQKFGDPNVVGGTHARLIMAAKAAAKKKGEHTGDALGDPSSTSGIPGLTGSSTDLGGPEDEDESD
jgi:hypothetical protein